MHAKRGLSERSEISFGSWLLQFVATAAVVPSPVAKSSSCQLTLATCLVNASAPFCLEACLPTIAA